MFHVRTGPFRALQEEFFADIQAIRRDDPLANLLVLSPSGRLLTHLQTHLAQKNPGYLNISFLTFYALAERLLSDSGHTEPIITEPALYQEMIREVLVGDHAEPVDRAIREALHLEGRPVSRGLAGALAATMKDLRDAGMRADLALKSARDGFLGVEAPEAAATLALYGRLIGLFEKHKIRSSADLLRRGTGDAPKNPWLRQQKAIFLYGFYDLTGVQLDLVLSLANHPDARVYFPYEKGNPAYAYAAKLLNDPAFVSKTAPSPLVGEGRAPKASGDGGISPPKSSPTRGEEAKCETWSCSGTRDEVWLAAKTILKLMDEGVPAQEIAVVARNLAPYAAPLKEILGANEIPMAGSRQEPAGSHPLFKTIWALVTFDEEHPNARTLREDLEKSPYIIPSPLVGEEVSSWSGHIRWASHLIRHSIRLPKDATNEEQSLLETILATLDELKILDVLNRGVTRAHFLDTWQEKLGLLERPGPNKAHAGVQVMEVQQARGLSFKAVLVLGMNEKVFPRLIREDPFLSDAARSALAQATGCRLGRKLDGYEEERFLFELMRQAATGRLFLFTQRSDEEGKTLIPSVYLKEVEPKGPKPHRLSRGLAEKFEDLPPSVWTPKELSFLINRARLNPAPVYKALGWNTSAFQKLLATHAVLEAFAPGIGSHDGALENLSLVQATLEKPFSPTGLEDLAECPFQYYAGHVLGIPVREDLAPEGEMTPQALGQLFHKVLELFYKDYFQTSFPAASGGEPINRHRSPTTTSGITEKLEKAIDTSLTEFSATLATVYPLALKASKILIFKELYTFLKSDIEALLASGFVPSSFEQPMEGSLPIDVQYHFHGKPDRLDTKEEGGITRIRVVDYKSGKPRTWSGRIETHLIQGRFLQLPIYLGLAKAESATLRPVRETDLEATEKTLTSAYWKTASATLFAENIKELIGIIEKANFYIEPDTGDWGYCRRCDFALICRKEHMPTRLRAERDPLRQRVSEKMSRIALKSA